MTLTKQLMLAAALSAGATHAAECERLYIGTHQQGGVPSLFSAGFNSKDGSFGAVSAMASIERPTWLVKDASRPVLYAVSETGNDGATHGKVLSLRIASSGALTEIASADSGGGGPTHLALDGKAGTLLVANYGTGHVAALAVADDGALSGPLSVVQDHGTGPSPRQRGPHAHGVVIDPSGRYALVADLGADRVFIYRYDAAKRQLAPAATPFLQLPPGTGPRHLVFSPDGHTAYLVAELTGDLHVYNWDAASGTLKAVQTLSTLTAGYAGKISAGEIIVSRDGRHVYVSNRGDNTIVVYAAAGRLSELQRVPSGGAQPWHLALSPDGGWLLSANEAANLLTSFRVAADGKLTATGSKLDVPKPSNIIFAGSCPSESALLLPTAAAPTPVVLLIADDGAAYDSLQPLAQALAAEGIASMRYASDGSDAAAIIEQLKKDTRFNKVVIIGHGRGALTGLLAANQVGANGFVALAGSGERTATEFGKLKMHARIIQGDADSQVSLDEARSLEQARPGTPTAIIPGMNHALKIAQPDTADQPVAPELVKALVGFINKR